MNRDRAKRPEDKRHRCVSLKVDDATHRQLTTIQQRLAKRARMRSVNMSTVLDHCILVATDHMGELDG